jgi:hypothetical protein
MRRMTAAAALLDIDRANGWVNVSRAWCCQLMGTGLVYVMHGTLQAFLSLGSDKWVWYAIELERVDHFTESFYCFPEKPVARFLPLFKSRDAPYYGIIVESLYPGSVPAPLHKYGLVFHKVSFELEQAVAFGLRNGVKMNKVILTSLCADYRLALPVRADKKQPSVRDLATALVNHIFLKELPETKDIMRFTRSRELNGGFMRVFGAVKLSPNVGCPKGYTSLALPLGFNIGCKQTHS